MEKEKEEMREVVMDWLYLSKNLKNMTIEKYVYFCKKSFTDQNVSSKRYEKILKSYQNWEDWEPLVRSVYLEFVVL